MRLRSLYLWLFVLGTVVPCAWLAPWLGQHGLDLPGLARELFANRVGGFFGLDVILSAVTLLVLVVTEVGVTRSQRALAALATFAAGVSSGLPLFLYFRQAALDGRKAQRAGEAL